MIYKSYLLEQNFDLLKTNLTLFYGENLGLQNDFKKIIKKKNNNALIQNINQEEIINNKNNFFIEILNTSLFNEEKIYFINHGNDKLLDTIKEIEPKLENRRIFIFAEILEKKSTLRNYFEKSKNCSSIACYQDNEISIKKIIQNRLKEFRGLNNVNLNIIFSNCNLDRVKLNNEIDKIILYFQDKIIHTENLELLLNDKFNDNFNNLKDEALCGNVKNTNNLISDTILQSEKNIFYLNLINQRLKKILDLREIANNENLEEAINKIKPPIFWKDKASVLNQAKKWNSTKIKKMMEKTYKLELELKSNSLINHNILIKNLIVDICNVANS